MTHTLLLADDSVTIRRVIELTFADESVRVVSVNSGREALAAFEGAPPDIVLADAGMPDVSGYDIAAFVKSRSDLRHIPVILLAGAFEPLDEARARTSGSDGVLVKPFEPQMVVARVRELLSRAQPVKAMPMPRADASAFDQQAPPADAPIDPMFDASLDRIDAAFANTAAQGAPALDASTATDFANDLRELGSGRPDSGGFEHQDFGDWDLPARPPVLDIEHPVDEYFREAPGAHEGHVPHLAPLPAAAAPPAAAMPAPVPLADAFSNLLAAEEGRPHGPVHSAIVSSMPATAALTDQDMELIVDRVIARLGLGVRGAVIDLAERLVKAEIDRLKALR